MDAKQELYSLLVRAEAIAVETHLPEVARLINDARYLIAEDDDD